MPAPGHSATHRTLGEARADEEGFYLDIFSYKHCPDCYEKIARKAN